MKKQWLQAQFLTGGEDETTGTGTTGTDTPSADNGGGNPTNPLPPKPGQGS
jgi:hypothetical protein